MGAHFMLQWRSRSRACASRHSRAVIRFIGVMAQGVVMRVFAFFFATLFLSNGWALAASQQDYQDCNAAGGDRTIAACTRIAEDPGAPADERYVLLLRRGVAYFGKGDLDRALADLN